MIFDFPYQNNLASNKNLKRITDRSIFQGWIKHLSEKILYYELLMNKSNNLEGERSLIITEKETKILITSLEFNENIYIKQFAENSILQSYERIFGQVESQVLSNGLNIYISIRMKNFDSNRKPIIFQNLLSLQRLLKKDKKILLSTGYKLNSRQIKVYNKIIRMRISFIQEVINFLEYAMAEVDYFDSEKEFDCPDIFLKCSDEHENPDDIFPFLVERPSYEYQRYELIYKNHTGSFEIAVLSNSEKYIIIGSNDCAIRCYKLSDHTLKFILFGHQSKVNCLYLFKNGTKLISAGYDRTIRVWSLSSKTHKILEFSRDSPIIKISVNSNEQYLAIGTSYPKIYVYSFSNKSIIFTCTSSPRLKYLKLLTYKIKKNVIITQDIDLNFKIRKIEKNSEIFFMSDVKLAHITKDNKILILVFRDHIEIRKLDKFSKRSMKSSLIAEKKITDINYVITYNNNQIIFVIYSLNCFKMFTFDDQYQDIHSVQFTSKSKIINSDQIMFLEAKNSKIYLIDYTANVCEIVVQTDSIYRNDLMEMIFFHQKNIIFDCARNKYLSSGYRGFFSFEDGHINKYSDGFINSFSSSSELLCYGLLNIVTISRLSDLKNYIYNIHLQEKCISSAISRDSHWIAFSDAKENLLILEYDGETVRLVHTLNKFENENILYCNFSLDSDILFAGGNHLSIFIIYFNKLPPIIKKVFKTDSMILKMLTLPRNWLLVACEYNGVISLRLEGETLKKEVLDTMSLDVIRTYGLCEAYKFRTLV